MNLIFVGNIKKFEFDEQQNTGSVNIFPPKKKMKIFKAPMASEFTEVPNLPPLKFSFVLPDGYPTVGFENFCNFEMDLYDLVRVPDFHTFIILAIIESAGATSIGTC